MMIRRSWAAFTSPPAAWSKRTEERPRVSAQRYVAAVRERCGVEGDRAFAGVLNELERRADA
jgi:hypothetical protein